MNLHRVVLRCSLLSVLVLALHPFSLSAQVRPRVTEVVHNAERVTLRGNVHPLARPEFDRGTVSDAQAMNRILLLLKRSDEQEAALATMLENQQDKGSPSYHQWLTPEQFGAQFGPADADIRAVTQWLTSQGFTINRVYSGKTVIEFSGSAAQVRQAFGTAIHSYQVNGKTYSANASDPQIPAALAPAVAGVVSLHNFPRQFYSRRFGILHRAGDKSEFEPLTTFPNPYGPGNFYGLGPGDFAKIYGIPTSCGTPIAACNGTGQTIAIVGETNFDVADVQQFRSAFGLPANFDATHIIYNGEDPGITSTDEESEALLDTQWSGAVAPGAMVEYVLSASTSASQGVDLSALYIVEHNLAGVMSESYGACESSLGTAEESFVNNLWEQAAAQGITVAVSTGDSGSAGCDDPHSEPIATNGPAVNGLASTPYNVAVGGTDFDEYNNWIAYWSATNAPMTNTSALGYIPEIPWNQSCGQLGQNGCNLNTTPGALQNIVAAGGGASQIYNRPSWQMGINGTLSANGKRDLPDVSLLASPGFNGTGYLYCQSKLQPYPCAAQTSGTYFDLGVIGGTSASAPAFAGIMALVNQSQASTQKPAPRQGNANYVLYALANKSGASCASKTPVAAGCLFNDIVAGSSALPTGGTGMGTIDVPCEYPTTDCNATAVTRVGVLENASNSTTMAWNAGAGYDLASGLGSVNVGNLIAAWGTASTEPTTTTLTLNPSSGLTHGGSTSTVTITVTPKTGTATGIVSLVALLPAQPSGTTSFGVAEFTLGANGSVTGSTQNLPGGQNYQIYAHYSGDGINAPSDSSTQSVTVAPENSQTFIVIPSFDSSGNLLNPNVSSVTYGSRYIIRVYVTNKNATANANGAPNGACAQASVVTCPSGTVALTEDGTPIDIGGGGPGIYNLDSIGYTRDLQPTVPGGTHMLVASYSGDGNYSSSSSSVPFRVIPATVSLGQVIETSPIIVGTSFPDEVTADSSALIGLAPTGTVTYFDGTAQLGNPVPVQSSPSAGSSPAFFDFGSLTLSSTGPHTIKAQYNGDTNYAATSVTATVNAYYPTSSTFGANTNSVNWGSPVTLTGTISTNVSSANAALKPKGTVTIVGSYDGPLNSSFSMTINSNASGNWQIQVSASATPSSTENYELRYSGDSNYASSGADTNGIVVNIPDFSLAPQNGLSIVPASGQSGSVPITITPLSQTPSTVSLQLQYQTTGIVGYSISLSPLQVNLSGSPVTATLSLTPNSGGQTATIRPQFRNAGIAPIIAPGWWRFGLAALLVVIFMEGRPGRRQRLPTALGLTAVCLLYFALGCGGGGGGNTGGGGGGGGAGGGGAASATSISLTTSNAKVPQYGNLTISATVTTTGKSPLTGTVTFFDYGNAISSSVALTSGQAQLSSQAIDNIVGVHQITAQYNGDQYNLKSTSSALTQAITGTIPFTIQGGTGTDVHSIQGSAGIQ